MHFFTLLTHIDVNTYGFDGLNNTNSTFNNSGVQYELSAPSLDIEVPFQTYVYSNLTYNLTYIQENGSCQQFATYQWGFSLYLLVITMILTSFWALGTYALWLDAYFNSRFDNSQWNMGTFRAVLDLADAINDVMSDDGQLKNLSNHELIKKKFRISMAGE